MTEVSKLDQLVDRCDTLVHGIIMNDAEALRLCVWTIAACLDDAKAELLRLRSGITPLDVVRIVECEEAIRATTLEAKDREIERLTAERDAARRDASQYERMHIDALQTASDEMDRASTLTRQLEEAREECAKIAETVVDTKDDGIDAFGASQIIAAAIRSLKQGERRG